MAHTPGKWLAVGCTVYVSVGEQMREVANGGSGTLSLPIEAQVANIKVMAAAPTMLDVLKEAAECLAHTGPETTIKAVDAAIKLAEGE